MTGRNGNLSRALRNCAPKGSEVLALSRAELDITDAANVARALDHGDPSVVFNTAAYNLVDRAEFDPSSAFHANELGPTVLAHECAKRGIAMIHFSTELVFDGAKRTPYTEADTPRPLSVYGASKLAGENAVLAASPRNVVARLGRMFGPVEGEGRPVGNFPLLMIKLARAIGKVRVVNDQVGSPSYAPDMADAVWQLTANTDGGLFQLSNAGEVSVEAYARAVFEIMDIDCEVEAVPSAEYGAPAIRPAYSTMSNEKAYRLGVTPLRHWRSALEEFLGTIKEADT